MRASTIFLAFIILAATLTSSIAQELFTPVSVYSGTADLSGVDFIPGTGELAVIEQRTGHVLAVDPATGTARVLIDISKVLKSSTPSEQGLAGIAVSPDYQQTGIIYLVYTDIYNRWTLSRFTNGIQEILIRADRYAAYHACGAMQFGPLDHYLYVCMGDSDFQGDPNRNAMNLEVLPGKVLRLDVLGRATGYGIPRDNPYPSTQSVRPEIWISGLRNPWMFAFDVETGDAYVPDVGFNGAEEINYVPHGEGFGASYGWPLFEGTAKLATPLPCESAKCSDGEQVAPLYWYAHDGDSCAIIGGAVVRTAGSPVNGDFLFGDLCSTQIRALRRTSDGVELAVVAELEAPPTAIRRAPDGTVYVADVTGAVSKLTASADAASVRWDKVPVNFATDNQKALIGILRSSTGKTIVLSVKDEATAHLSAETRDQMAKLGLTKIAELASRDSYAAVLRDGKVLAEEVSHEGPVELNP